MYTGQFLLSLVCLFPDCRYYSLEVSYFKSSLDSHLLDLLWNKYWVNTLSSCSMITVSPCLSDVDVVFKHWFPSLQNADYTTQQIADLSQKLERAEFQVQCILHSSLHIFHNLHAIKSLIYYGVYCMVVLSIRSGGPWGIWKGGQFFPWG